LQRSQFKEVNYNELNTGVVELLKKIRNEGVTEEFYQWVSRETFNKHKNDNDWFGGLLKTVWTFGSNQKSYLYGKNIELDKNILHNIVVKKCDKSINDFFIKNNILIDLKSIDADTINQRRLNLQTLFCKLLKKNNVFKQIQPHLTRVELLNEISFNFRIDNLTRINNLKQLQYLNGLIISNQSYIDVSINTPVNETVIYCDPPYRNTSKYEIDLDHNIFNEWVKNSPYKIYVSSYESDLNCVLEMNHRSTLSQTKNNKVIEKLFCNKIEVIDNKY
jgi:16S rRNA G966 N2-methylase RsmD